MQLFRVGLDQSQALSEVQRVKLLLHGYHRMNPMVEVFSAAGVFAAVLVSREKGTAEAQLQPETLLQQH